MSICDEAHSLMIRSPGGCERGHNNDAGQISHAEEHQRIDIENICITDIARCRLIGGGHAESAEIRRAPTERRVGTRDSAAWPRVSAAFRADIPPKRAYWRRGTPALRRNSSPSAGWSGGRQKARPDGVAPRQVRAPQSHTRRRGHTASSLRYCFSTHFP